MEKEKKQFYPKEYLNQLSDDYIEEVKRIIEEDKNAGEN